MVRFFDNKIIDIDKRRRITGMIFNPTAIANYTNSIIYSLYLDSQSRFVPTRDTIFPISRLDTSNVLTDIYLYTRKSPIGTIPLASTPFLEGGYGYTNFPINNLQTSVEIVPKTEIYDSVTKQGINGWSLTKIAYQNDKGTRSDLYEGIRPPLNNVDEINPVYQIALVVDTSDNRVQVTGHIHFDMVGV